MRFKGPLECRKVSLWSINTIACLAEKRDAIKYDGCIIIYGVVYCSVDAIAAETTSRRTIQSMSHD